MKKSEIHFTVDLDKQNVPERITWDATDNPNEGINDTKAISVAVWDTYHKGTMKIDLWTKDMDVIEMKQFCLEIIKGLGETIRNATSDEKMAGTIDDMCDYLGQHLKDEIGKAPR